MKKITLLILITGAFIFSCKKKEQNQVFEDIPIVQAYMEPGQPLNLNVSRQIPLDAEDAKFSNDDINNLTVTLAYNNSIHTLKPLGNGNYVDSSIIVSVGASYKISFQFNNKQTIAYTVVPVKPSGYTQSDTAIAITAITGTTSGGGSGFSNQPNPIELTWTNADNSNYVLIIENVETNPVLINSSSSATAPTSRRFRIKPTNTNHLSIRSRQFQYYGKTRLILYHINPDYAALYDNSGNSSQNLTNPSTSIENGYGIFTATNSDTLFVHVKTP